MQLGDALPALISGNSSSLETGHSSIWSAVRKKAGIAPDAIQSSTERHFCLWATVVVAVVDGDAYEGFFVSKSVIAQARQRLGAEPLKAQFAISARA